jgi:hypothetical protein
VPLRRYISQRMRVAVRMRMRFERIECVVDRLLHVQSFSLQGIQRPDTAGSLIRDQSTPTPARILCSPLSQIPIHIIQPSLQQVSRTLLAVLSSEHFRGLSTRSAWAPCKSSVRITFVWPFVAAKWSGMELDEPTIVRLVLFPIGSSHVPLIPHCFETYTCEYV